jgi:predicted methyltransferase
VDYVRGAADAVPVPPGTIDLALVADVYHELSEPDVVLASLRAALAPGGRVAVVEFRLEGNSAAFVKPEHRMAADQVIREWTAAGFRLDGRVDTLPTQHLLLFAP